MNQLTEKEKMYLNEWQVRIHYYRCLGINGQITPVSKKYYDMAKVGDDITVVQTSMRYIAVGITFREE